jgi:molybdate transport system substrate-binding protein
MRMLKASLTLAVALVIPAAARGDDAATTIHVSVAASFRDVMEVIAASFRKDNPQATVTLNYGGSGLLARQIEDGAPVDVFLSAGWPEIERLKEKGLVAGSPVVVAHNRLVVVVPKGSPWIGKPPKQALASPEIKRIAVGDPASVPFGAYAKQALTAVGLWDTVAAKAVYAGDVRQALAYADADEVGAAIVYATDARVAKTARLLGDVPGADAIHIEAPAVRTTHATSPVAQKFLAFLTSPAARAALAAQGFIVPAS